jgi:CobQ-like glutamine amidotransferase family enzyme
MELKICHLYPDVLNLYGDRGNILCMQKRLAWRGIACTVTELPIGESASLSDFDLFFIGGGQDFEQGLLLEDLRRGKANELRAAVEDGKTFLCVCGGYQMMGHYYETAAGQRCEFLGAVDLYTVGSDTRMIGNFAFELGRAAGSGSVVGFENHSGKTYLGAGVMPLGRVLKGFGNNGEDGTEGVRWKNVFGTYSHGPVLPKNPDFCDRLLTCALEGSYGAGVALEPLEDLSEREAHDGVLSRLLSRRDRDG